LHSSVAGSLWGPILRSAARRRARTPGSEQRCTARHLVVVPAVPDSSPIAQPAIAASVVSLTPGIRAARSGLQTQRRGITNGPNDPAARCRRRRPHKKS
jgi:hypothetical protein